MFKIHTKIMKQMDSQFHFVTSIVLSDIETKELQLYFLNKLKKKGQKNMLLQIFCNSLSWNNPNYS